MNYFRLGNYLLPIATPCKAGPIQTVSTQLLEVLGGIPGVTIQTPEKQNVPALETASKRSVTWKERLGIEMN